MVPTALKQKGRRFKSGIDDLGVLWQHNIIYLYELNQYYITVYILIVLILLHVCREK